jgi:hypothetical protein
MRETHWSGWDGGHSNTTSTKVWVQERTVLSPETMGHNRSDYGESETLFYEIEIDRIVNDIVIFAFRRLVVENRGGGINLSGPTSDKFILRRGETKRLATPTMDGGTGVHVTVDEMQ